MRFEFREVAALPRLAWCACLRRGDERVQVVHGPRVEALGDRFVEGAWDGPFAEGGFEDALTLAGTGGRAGPEGAVFAASTSGADRLHLVRRGDELFVSNSLVFALVQAGDEPSPAHPYYEHDFFLHAILGIRRRRRSLPTRLGVAIVHECANVRVTPGLEWARVEKAPPPEPTAYKDYLELLEGTTRRLFANAADPARRQRYRPLASLSRGYDSPAAAELARRAGCSEAATFAESDPGVADPDDDGRPLGACLGLEVKPFARNARPLDRPLHDAEFAVCPHGAFRTWLAAERELEGRVFVGGRWGDAILVTDMPHPPLNLQRHPRFGMAGTLNEFRLRVGFVNYGPWLTGWQHARAIHRITLSDEMRPWRLGGDYDRPIPRRILEEAGVPRDLFGREKLAGGHDALWRVENLHPAALPDYRAFVRSLDVPLWLRAKSRVLCALAPAPPAPPERRRRGPPGRLERTWTRLFPRRQRLPLADGYLFHWGFARTRERYRTG